MKWMTPENGGAGPLPDSEVVFPTTMNWLLYPPPSVMYGNIRRAEAACSFNGPVTAVMKSPRSLFIARKATAVTPAGAATVTIPWNGAVADGKREPTKAVNWPLGGIWMGARSC